MRLKDIFSAVIYLFKIFLKKDYLFNSLAAVKIFFF